MQSVTYLKGRARFKRVLRVSDLDRLSIPHKNEDLVFTPENHFTIVMSNKMSDSLVAAFPQEFRSYPAKGEDESPEEVLAPLTSLTPPQSPQLDGFEDQSLESPADDVKSSKGKSQRDA